MKSQNIVKIIALIIGVIAAIFFIRIMSIGDDAIEADVANQGILSSFMTLAFITLGLATVVTLVFSLINLITHPAKLKKALISIVVFLAVVFIAYLTASDWMPAGSEEKVSASGAKWVEAGLKAFYFLVIAAVGVMIWGGAKKLSNR